MIRNSPLHSKTPSDPETKEIRKLRHVATEAILFSALALAVSGWPIYSQFLGAAIGNSPIETQVQSSSPQASTGSSIAQGMSAYDLWVALGNIGSAQDFLNALIGEPGEPGEDGQVIYRSSTGLTGPSGKSAYQLWLDSGNTGTQGEFFAALIGPVGPSGPTGPAGEVGLAGLSAYELWLAIGNLGTEEDFLSSLVGPAGVAGETGAAGLSAYQIWLANGNQGTTQDFLNSLKGEQGPQGPKGDPGENEVGVFGYFYDLADQNLDPISPTPKALSFSNSPTGDSGLSLSTQNGANSKIEFDKPGWYAITYSMNFENQHKRAHTAEVWFVENANNLEDSAIRYNLPNETQTVVNGTYFYFCSDPSAQLEMMWFTSASEFVTVKFSPAINGQPAIPSVRLTLHRVDD